MNFKNMVKNELCKRINFDSDSDDDTVHIFDSSMENPEDLHEPNIASICDNDDYGFETQFNH